MVSPVVRADVRWALNYQPPSGPATEILRHWVSARHRKSWLTDTRPVPILARWTSVVPRNRRSVASPAPGSAAGSPRMGRGRWWQSHLLGGAVRWTITCEAVCGILLKSTVARIGSNRLCNALTKGTVLNDAASPPPRPCASWTASHDRLLAGGADRGGAKCD